MPTPVQTPVITPTISPSESPWHEQFTDPSKICDQQRREGAGGDLPL